MLIKSTLIFNEFSLILSKQNRIELILMLKYKLNFITLYFVIDYLSIKTHLIIVSTVIR
jgi:hypothetical protein